MARTIDQIYGEMIAQKEETEELNELTSTSKTAVWRLIFYICAVAISIVENLFDLHKEYIDYQSFRAISGNLLWYSSETLKYQHGDTLFYDRETGRLDYAEEIPELQIVKLSASIDDSTGAVYVKAAKIENDEATELTTEELDGLIGYWNQKKFAGTDLTVLSEPADKLKIGYKILYNATILNGDGELLADTTIKPVEDAINNYLIEFGIENFNGDFQLMNMTDAVQAATGVFNAVCYEAEAVKDDDTGLTDILADEDHIYSTVAGYMKVNPAYPLSTTIIYEAIRD